MRSTFGSQCRILSCLATLPFLFGALSVSGQTGPAGVGNSTSNVIWFSADQGVTGSVGVVHWADRSGNANHATQPAADRRPVLQDNAINGYPALVFDNSETAADYLRVPDNANLEGMAGMTAFAVYDLFDGTPASAPRGILSKRVSPSSNVAYGWFHWNSSGSLTQHLDIDGTTNRISGGVINTNTTYVNSFKFAGSSPSNSQNQVLYRNGEAVANGAESSVTVPDYASDFYVGSLYGHTGSGSNATRFNGRIAEVIVYRSTLNDAQRIIIQNYLSAKYGTALASDDLYTMDDPANGDFDHDMAGIGRISSSHQQTDSKGSGIVRINNPNGLNNGEFLFWGHDNGVLGAWGIIDRPATVQGRLQRVWRVSEVNTAGVPCDVGAVDITFDLNGLGPVDADHLRLLVDVSGNGLFADESPISGAVDAGGGNYRFSGVTALTNGRRFTLATTNIDATPLPVELVTFSARTTDDRTVDLSWATASEYNSSHFQIERSTTANEWQEVALIPAAGWSNSTKDYSVQDHHAPAGTVYYRLGQFDLDGTRHDKGMVAVSVQARRQVLLYPNPATGIVHIDTGGSDVLAIEIQHPDGRPLRQIRDPAVRSPVDLTGSPAGIYLIKVFFNDGNILTNQLVLAGS